MRAASPKTEFDASVKNVAENAPSQLSLRTVSGLEIASVVSSVLITAWAIIPLAPGQRWLAVMPGILAAGLIINSHRVRGETARQLGFSSAYFGKAAKLLAAPTLCACAVFLSIGYLNDSFRLSSNFRTTLLFLPFWGILQQWVLQGFIYRRVRTLIVGGESGGNRINLAILASSAVFSFVHAPNPALMALTFIGGLIWSWVYERAPNLFALGLSHAVMSLLLMTTLPSWLLQSMSVGYKHFLYQKF